MPKPAAAICWKVAPLIQRDSAFCSFSRAWSCAGRELWSPPCFACSRELLASATPHVKPPVRGQVPYWDKRLTNFGLRVSQGGKKTQPGVQSEAAGRRGGRPRAGVPEVLAYLLPCSIVISALQVADGGLSLEPIRRKLLAFTAPAVLLGTFLILVVLKHKIDMRPIVGAMLVVTAALRLLGPLRQRMQSFVRARLSPLLVLLGLIHGVSNLGGGFLTLIISSVYDDKQSVRKHIAFGYGLMALIQIAVLF